jgi:hypothetical protein
VKEDSIFAFGDFQKFDSLAETNLLRYVHHTYYVRTQRILIAVNYWDTNGRIVDDNKVLIDSGVGSCT